MEWHVVFIVLASACAHASWNVFIKMGGDRLSSTALMFFFTGVIGVVYLPFSAIPWPSVEVWGYLLVSAVFHIIYIYCLSVAYELDDFTKTYPIARGAAPIVSVAIAAGLGVEFLTSTQWVALFLIIIGVLTLSGSTRQFLSLHADKTTALALLIALLIGLYTFIDGTGARLHGEATSYIAWTFILFGFPFALFALRVRPQTFLTMAFANWHKGLAAATVSALAYMAATWAMTQAPIGLVAVLRETSVLFGLLLAHFVLKEKFGLQRVLATCVIFAGIVVLKL